MKQLRVSGVVFKAVEGGVEIETEHRGLGCRIIFIPDSTRRITPTQARRIAWWFADLAEELEKKP